MNSMIEFQNPWLASRVSSSILDNLNIIHKLNTLNSSSILDELNILHKLNIFNTKNMG